MNSRNKSPIRPSWLRLCAYGAFFVVIPSALWRVLMITGLMPGTGAFRAFQLDGGRAEPYVYVFGLSIVSLSAAYLTIGLVRPWGERLFGRSIPPIVPLVLGTLGGAVVTWLFTIQMPFAIPFGHRPDAGTLSGWPLAVMAWCYLPILLWGPLTIASSWGYWHCRRTQGAA